LVEEDGVVVAVPVVVLVVEVLVVDVVEALVTG
jgi:hypothetical protein